MKKFTLGFIAMFVLITSNCYSQTWEEVTSGTSFILFGMSFPPGQNEVGYACGMQYTYDAPGVIIKTVDGGDTWSTILPVSGEIEGLQAICFIDENTGFAGGWNNYFIKTTDGGVTWTDVSVGSNIWYFTDIEFWDENNGVAIAQMDGGGQPVFITSDGGDTWTQATSGVNQVPFDITYASATTLYLVGNTNAVSKSTDGGYTWTTIYNASAGLLFGVDFEDTNFGVIGGEETIFATNNSGNSWSSYFTGYELFSATLAFEGDSAYVGGTDENIYKTIDGGTSWEMAYNGTGESHLYKFAMTSNKTIFACGSGGLILKKEAPLNADFEADNTTVCEGTSVNYSDLSAGAITWSWTFEGGTPATSSDQNPTVMYSASGVYDVSLTVTDGLGGSSTMNKSNYIIVIEAPGQADIPSGDVEVCSGLVYEYSTNPVVYAESYDWSVTPESAGTFTGDGTTAFFIVSESYTGSYTINVRAWNMCDYGDWSDDFTGTINMSPAEFELSGSGEICDGDPGIEIELSGSEVGVDYELFNNEGSTGIIVSGTGNPISFGLFTEQNNYTAVGFTSSCSTDMIGEGSVLVNQAPEQLSIPNGPTEVCNETENVYTTTNAQNSDDVIWALSPDNAGSVTSDGMMATIEWSSSFEGAVSLTVWAENSCGAGPVSDPLEIQVNSAPNVNITGDDLVCNNEETYYSTPGTEGNTYSWEIIGGTVISGEGTSEIVVSWGQAPGMGYVILTESQEQGCSSNDSLAVTIDDCTGVETNQENNTVRVYPNPAADFVFIKSKDKILNASLIDSETRTLLNREIQTNDCKLILGNINSGIYFLRIVTENEIVTRKLIIK